GGAGVGVRGGGVSRVDRRRSASDRGRPQRESGGGDRRRSGRAARSHVARGGGRSEPYHDRGRPQAGGAIPRPVSSRWLGSQRNVSELRLAPAPVVVRNVDSVPVRVRERMVEDVHRLLALTNFEAERVPRPGISHGDRQLPVALAPEKPDVDAVAHSAVKLSHRYRSLNRHFPLLNRHVSRKLEGFGYKFLRSPIANRSCIELAERVLEL